MGASSSATRRSSPTGQTVQPLRLIPTPSLPESYTRTQIVDVTPQDL